MPHIHEKIDYTVEVFIVYKDQVLLRMHDKYKIWLSVGGHVELDEDPNEAAIREVKEETGLKVELWDSLLTAPRINNKDYKELIPPKFLMIHSINETHRHCNMTFFAKSESDVIKPEYADDISNEFKWVTKEELEKMDLKNNIKIYALEALKELEDK